MSSKDSAKGKKRGSGRGIAKPAAKKAKQVEEPENSNSDVVFSPVSSPIPGTSSPINSSANEMSDVDDDRRELDKQQTTKIGKGRGRGKKNYLAKYAKHYSQKNMSYVNVEKREDALHVRKKSYLNATIIAWHQLLNFLSLKE